MDSTACVRYDEKTKKCSVTDWMGRSLVSGQFDANTAQSIATAINQAWAAGIEAERRVFQSRVNKLFFEEE